MPLTLRPLAPTDRALLEGVLRSDETFRELLASRAILQYVNDEEWYGVNPLINLPAAKTKKK